MGFVGTISPGEGVSSSGIIGMVAPGLLVGPEAEGLGAGTGVGVWPGMAGELAIDRGRAAGVDGDEAAVWAGAGVGA